MHYYRIFNVMIAQFVAYLFLIISMVKGDEDVGIPCATIAAIIFMFAKAIGEATIVGFMKALP